jgi:hypothetical protein
MAHGLHSYVQREAPNYELKDSAPKGLCVEVPAAGMQVYRVTDASVKN